MFNGGEKCILTRSDKYYLADTGLAYINNSGFKTELGALIENIVFNEWIHRGYEMYVGKTRSGEIDFIVNNGEDKTVLLVREPSVTSLRSSRHLIE